MRYALDVAPFGDLSDPLTLVRLAEAAEAAGWDGFSTWDTLGLAMDSVAADPFVALAGVAAATERLALLASVIVLPRRRPQLVAQAAATLDRLSGGRLVLGVGAGGDRPDYEAFGEDWTSAVRVARMDEAVEIVDAFLRGESVTHAGPDFPIDGVGIGPRPAQQPRPPIWMGAFRPGGIRRAARWDGWIAVTTADDPGSSGCRRPAWRSASSWRGRPAGRPASTAARSTWRCSGSRAWAASRPPTTRPSARPGGSNPSRRSAARPMTSSRSPRRGRRADR